MDAEIAAALAFEVHYAIRSGVTVEWLRQHGRIVAPCDCGAADCPGWQSISRELFEAGLREGIPRVDKFPGVWSWPPEVAKPPAATGGTPA